MNKEGRLINREFDITLKSEGFVFGIHHRKDQGDSYSFTTCMSETLEEMEIFMEAVEELRETYFFAFRGRKESSIKFARQRSNLAKIDK